MFNPRLPSCLPFCPREDVRTTERDFIRECGGNVADPREIQTSTVVRSKIDLV